tara:strand:- start:2166 stop:2678 length:513 start_codon:yes stop_codon:yes gene_type:complete
MRFSTISKRFTGFFNKRKFNWKIVSAVILLVIVLTYIMRFRKNEGMEVNNKEYQNNQDNQDNRKEAKLYFFYADWCPHCRTAKQPGGPWNKFTEKHNDVIIKGDYDVFIEEVDCSSDDNKHKGRYGVKEMMHKYKVEGYPTIILVKDGDHYLYDTKPDADRIEEFVDTYF